TAGHGHDWDFGSSPTLFGGGTPPDVGACNKNGRYYALTAKPLGSSPLWTDTVAAADGTIGSCYASAVWGGPVGTLYIGAGATTTGRTSYGGSIRQVNPATGGYIWQTGLPCTAAGTPTLDNAGVLAVGTFRCVAPNPPTAYLINAATGAILTTLPVGVNQGLWPASVRPGHPVRRHRDKRPLRLRTLTETPRRARIARAH